MFWLQQCSAALNAHSLECVLQQCDVQQLSLDLVVKHHLHTNVNYNFSLLSKLTRRNLLISPKYSALAIGNLTHGSWACPNVKKLCTQIFSLNFIAYSKT